MVLHKQRGDLLQSKKMQFILIKKVHLMRTDGLKVKPLLFLPRRPADRTASSGLSPRLFPPPEGWVEAAGGNNTASVQADKDWLIDWVSNPG